MGMSGQCRAALTLLRPCVMPVQLYKGGQSVWATGTDREQTQAYCAECSGARMAAFQHPHHLCL